ncbi:DNA replication complex GINS protein PSF1-like protein [Dinothrombium tinctorium]|uniref:DNA replication complex GINS protein PSF1 n=1 Tax=Dinothrombium tinctorium TaxID=1965070 RepID=A0A3S3P2J9_9ACAR|nr:DNA replication complex GINS protein PSF1-like protein [Dinothrombium tinctorium]
MFGEKAIELIKDLIRSKNEPLPPYKASEVREVIDEMNALFEMNQKDVQSQSQTQEVESQQDLFTVIQVRHSALLWNKRCLIAYHYQRLMRLKQLRWEFGGVLPTDIRNNLNDHEVVWFNSYCSNLATYMSRLNDGRGIDLTLHMKAPKRLYVQVRCLLDYGDYELEDGTTAVLSKDSTHYLPLQQCEKLIHQGILEQILT